MAHSSENCPVQGLDSKLKKHFKRPENNKCGISVFLVLWFSEFTSLFHVFKINQTGPSLGSVHSLCHWSTLQKGWNLWAETATEGMRKITYEHSTCCYMWEYINIRAVGKIRSLQWRLKEEAGSHSSHVFSLNPFFSFSFLFIVCLHLLSLWTGAQSPFSLFYFIFAVQATQRMMDKAETLSLVVLNPIYYCLLGFY